MERVNLFGNKLYLEFGGKLFGDMHAARVLPGFKPNNKINLLKNLADITEIVMVIAAADIEANRIQGDQGITYGDDLCRLIDAFREHMLLVSGVVITQYANQGAADDFRRRLEGQGIKVYLHYPIENYPANVPHIVSEAGFGINEYIETTRPLVVVTAPGAGSGKMGTCLSQLYHELKRGVKAGYAKFETFPVWNLPIAHPVNLAYEAATTDIHDVNVIDHFHMDAYGTSAVNYNRDVEGFPILNAIFEKIWGQSPYKSPTDMGVNMVGHCIDGEEGDAVCRVASQQEIVRRYYAAQCHVRLHGSDRSEVQQLEILMLKAGATVEQRVTVGAALAKQEQSGTNSLAIQLPDGRVITGRTSPLLGAASAALLNALKALAGLEDEVRIISPRMIEPIQRLKTGFMGNNNPRLHTDEVLIALSICTETDPQAAQLFEQLPNLRNSEAHSTVILSQVDISVFRKLGVNITCEPKWQNKKIYHKR